MRTVTYDEYSKDLKNFIDKHSKKCDWKVYTSPLIDGQYHKNIVFEDGSEFTEINELNYSEVVEIMVHNIPVTVTVDLIRHEYWSTDDSVSKYWYEKR